MPKIGTPREKTNKPTAAQQLHNPDMIVYPRVNAEDVTILGVDPGGAKGGGGHVGVALGCRHMVDDNPFGAKPSYVAVDPGWRVYDFAEMTPDEFVMWFFPRIGMFDIVTCEDWRLYPEKAKTLSGSRMETSMLLGWLEFTVKVYNARPHAERPPERKLDIVWESHMKQIHKGTIAVLNQAGIPFITPATPDHARSAEIHLWHTLIRNHLVNGVTLR